MSSRALAALHDDPRLELFATDELTADAVSFAERVAGVIIATDSDPLSALAYALTAGMRGPFVIATSARYKSERSAVMDAGAAACVLMPVTREAVTRFLPRLRKQSALAHIDASLHLLLDPIGRVVRYGRRSVRLSQREFAVLHCLSARRGRPVGADELLAIVWGDGARDRPRQIVDVYVHQLRKKLQTLGLKNAISTVRRFGYALGQNGSGAAR